MVYANLASDNFKEQAETIVEAMHKAGKTRLAWFSTLGIYDEVPGKFGQWNNTTLVDHEVTQKDESFKGLNFQESQSPKLLLILLRNHQNLAKHQSVLTSQIQMETGLADCKVLSK